MALIEARPSGTVLKQSSDAITLTVYADGATATITSATLTLKRADGTNLYNGVTVTPAANVLSKTLSPTADTNRCDVLTATWTVVVSATTYIYTSIHDVIGARLFDLGQARSGPDGGAELASTTIYPAATILAGHDRILNRFEDICGVSFVPRAIRETYDGNGGAQLILRHQRPRIIFAVSIVDTSANVTTYTGDDLADIRRELTGVLTRYRSTWAGGYQNVVIEYEYGYDSPPPEITRAALIVLRHELVRSNTPDEASQVNEFGMNWSRVVDPSRGRWYGLPEVDGVLRNQRGPMVA